MLEIKTLHLEIKHTIKILIIHAIHYVFVKIKYFLINQCGNMSMIHYVKMTNGVTI